MIRAPTILPLKIRALPDIRSVAQLSRVARTELSILSPEYPRVMPSKERSSAFDFLCVSASLREAAFRL